MDKGRSPSGILSSRGLTRDVQGSTFTKFPQAIPLKTSRIESSEAKQLVDTNVQTKKWQAVTIKKGSSPYPKASHPSSIAIDSSIEMTNKKQHRARFGALESTLDPGLMRQMDQLLTEKLNRPIRKINQLIQEAPQQLDEEVKTLNSNCHSSSQRTS